MIPYRLIRAHHAAPASRHGDGFACPASLDKMLFRVALAQGCAFAEGGAADARSVNNRGRASGGIPDPMEPN